MTESKARVRFIEQAITAQEEERARIARELHDGIGQSLTSLLVGLKSLESTLVDDSDAKKLASQLRETTGRAIDEVRVLAHGLRPTALDDLGLGPAIERLVEDMAARHRIAIDVQTTALDAEPRLPPFLEITIYRIVQEALHNVAKHAQARSASVVLERRADLVRIIVEDDGKGMADPEQGGFGLQGIRERLALVKGELTIESSPRKGTALFATVPCRARAPRRFSVLYGEHEVPLPPGEYVIGRSSECELQFERRRISRRHAKLMIGDYEAYVEDLGSMNGVFVNGHRTEGSVRLGDDDHIVIGDEQLRIRSILRQGNGAPSPAWGSERTLPGIVPRESQSRARDVTERANMLEIAGMMALRWMDEGRAADAERVLSGHLRQVIESARAGQPVRASVVETSASHALRLASATKNAGWARYALELLALTATMPSASTAASLDRLRQEGSEVPMDALQAYLGALEGVEPPSGVTGFALEQLRKMVVT